LNTIEHSYNAANPNEKISKPLARVYTEITGGLRSLKYEA